MKVNYQMKQLFIVGGLEFAFIEEWNGLQKLEAVNETGILIVQGLDQLALSGLVKIVSGSPGLLALVQEFMPKAQAQAPADCGSAWVVTLGIKDIRDSMNGLPGTPFRPSDETLRHIQEFLNKTIANKLNAMPRSSDFLPITEEQGIEWLAQAFAEHSMFNLFGRSSIIRNYDREVQPTQTKHTFDIDNGSKIIFHTRTKEPQ